MKENLIPQTGLMPRIVDDGLAATAEVAPELCVPGTDELRMSVLVLWADVMCGLLVSRTVRPRVPVTLELSVEMFAPAVLGSTVSMSSKVVKAGGSVTHVDAEILVDDRPAGLATVSFMLAPDVTLELPRTSHLLQAFDGGPHRLAKPYAERVDCDRVGPGVARLPRTEETINASGTIHGGVIAVPAEEAVLSAEPAGSVLTAMTLRYLRPARVGPAVATAERFGDLWRVEVADAGAESRACVLTTARTRRP